MAGCGSNSAPEATATLPSTPAVPTVTAVFLPTPTLMPVATSQETVHIVQPGDTLSKLAQTYQTTVEAIQQANNIKDPNVIAVGQKLTIPKSP